MAVKTSISKQVFNQILLQYELGSYVHSEPVSQGNVQTNYFLYTDRGKYVFRYYENRSKESVLFENDLLTYLRKHQYPCPTPIQNKHGIGVSVYQGKPFVIYEFLGGESIEHHTEYQKQQLVQKVAELQILTQGYQPQYKQYRWNYNVELCQTLARAEAEKAGTEDARRKLSWMEEQLAKLELPETIPIGICHCDFHFSNVLYKDDELVGILDFDDANYTYLVFDLVCLIDGEWPFPAQTPNWQTARSIVEEYEKYRSIDVVEKRHMFDVHKLGILFDGIWFFGRGQADDFYERRKIEFLNSIGWKEYADRLFHTAP